MVQQPERLFVKTPEAAAILGISPKTLELWRHRGKGPQFQKIGRAVRYHRANLEKWALDRTFQNTVEAAM